jgi:L-fucose isomerase-like protein
VHNFVGSRIVALGGPWGKYAADAPEKAKQQFKLDIVDVTYDDLGRRIRRVWNDRRLVSFAEKWTNAYATVPGTKLESDRKFVVNAFLLYGTLRDLLREHDASIFTINRCMGTILPMAQTTACLTLSLLNDEGLVAFCESDFVIIPAGILLHYLAGQPVFLHNSTFPHKALVTCAHCTSPRRMDGARYEPARILTHYESEYGAATKVDMPIGQEVTFINPDFASGRWVGMKGSVEANPFYEICRSQQDVRIHGDWERLLDEVRDSHWVMAYGDFLQEIGHAARRIGVVWETI